MPGWYLLYDQKPLRAIENMARDEFLFQLCHREKLGFLRFYSWEKPTFSFGVSQKIARAINLEFIRENGCSFVRRITGGKTVLHDDEITYSVVSSEDVFFRNHDLYKSYGLIAEVIVDAFRQLGVEASLSSRKTSSLARSHNPCFSFPTLNEIEIKGKKIVGSAQKRDQCALLQHGSIPFTMNYDLYSRGTNSDPDIIRNNMTTFSEVSPKPKSVLIDSVISNFQNFIAQPLESYEFDENAKKDIKRISTKYSSKNWNFCH